MENATNQGAPGLPSGAANLVSKWVFCTISDKKSPEKLLRLKYVFSVFYQAFRLTYNLVHTICEVLL